MIEKYTATQHEHVCAEHGLSDEHREYRLTHDMTIQEMDSPLFASKPCCEWLNCTDGQCGRPSVRRITTWFTAIRIINEVTGNE